MHSTLTVYITLICTSSVFILYLGLRVLMKRHNYSAVANYFLFYTSAIAIYCFASAMALTATTLGQIKFWTVIQYVGLPVSSPLGLLFVMKYLGIHVSKKMCGALLFIPFLTFMMVLTNDWHQLHYQVFEADPVLGLPFIYLEIGSWYAIHGIYIFGCMFIAVLLLFSHWKETAKVYRPQLAALLIGQLVPMVTAFLYLIGLTPSGVDPVPMVLWVTSLLYLWAITSSRLFTIMPIAKASIFNSINDGVVVLDDSYRLIEFNASAKKSFPILNKSLFGEDIAKLWKGLTGKSLALDLKHADAVQEVELTAGNEKKVYQVRVSFLEQQKNDKGLLLIFTDITELKKLQALLEQRAYYDELTGIYNRRAFIQQGEQNFDEAKEASLPFSVILIDIDHFKKVNDTYGHHLGDQMLTHVVQMCQSQLDKGQLFARYGGEEFAIALKDCTAPEAENIGNYLREYVKPRPLVTAQGAIAVTLSLGVAAGTEDNLDQLLNRADKALYEAKHAGRDQVRVYGSSKEAYN